MPRRCLYLCICALILITIVQEVEAGKDYYKILGVSRDASPKEIRRAYRTLAQKYHPDKNPGNNEVKLKYTEISNAYEALNDAEKKEIYDREGEEGLTRNENAQDGGGGFDPFSMFFGGGGRQQQKRSRGPRDWPKQQNTIIPLDVTLEDLYLGKTITVSHRKQVLCTKCAGSGAKDPKDVTVCRTCKGTGVRTVTQQLGPGFMTQSQQTCDRCGGKGAVSKTKCPHCMGNKVEIGEDTITLMIEQGMNPGQEITFEEEGHQVPETIPGDLIFQINQLPHARFERRGNDLHMKTSISLLEALTGFTKVIKHLDGHKVTLERSEITIPGQVIKIASEGMPIFNSYENGDLYLEFSIRFPTILSEEKQLTLKEVLKGL